MKKKYNLIFEPGKHYSTTYNETQYFDEKSNFATIQNNMRSLSLTRSSVKELLNKGLIPRQNKDNISFILESEIEGISTNEFIEKISEKQKMEKDIYVLKNFSNELITSKEKGIEVLSNIIKNDNPKISKVLLELLKTQEELAKKIRTNIKTLTNEDIKIIFRYISQRIQVEKGSYFLNLQNHNSKRIINSYSEEITFREEQSGNIIHMEDNKMEKGLNVKIYPRNTKIDFENNEIAEDNKTKPFFENTYLLSKKKNGLDNGKIEMKKILVEVFKKTKQTKKDKIKTI